jgi:hypothetical protein
MKFENRIRDLQEVIRKSLNSAALATALLLLMGTLSLGQSWHAERVDSTGHEVGTFSSLGVDGDGNLHLAYWDATGNAPRGQLVYAYRGVHDKEWSHMVLDTDGTYVSLAVDKINHPHIAYNSKRENGLHYAYWDGSRWHRQTIDPGHINYLLCIQVDDDGHPKISYYLYHQPSGEYSLHLKYAYSDGKQWYIQTVDQRDHTGKMNSLALDQQGNPSIAYVYVGNGVGDMFFTRWDGEQWQFSVADRKTSENRMYSMGNSVGVDFQGHAHIAYLDSYSKALKCVSWDGTRWKVEKVDTVSSVSLLDHPSLKVDREGRIHIAYADAGAGILKYAIRGNEGWKTEVVDHEGDVGLHPSLALDPKGDPCISYYDVENQTLRFARRDSTVAASVPKKAAEEKH